MRVVAWRIVVLALALTLITSPAEAQRRPRGRAAAVAGPSWGGHLGYNFDIDQLLLGAQASFPIVPRASLYPSFDYFFVDVGSTWSLNLDLKYHPRTRYGAFYFGGGINYTRVSAGGSGAGDTGLGLIGGLERRRRTAPYVEARLVLGGAEYFQIVGGFSWRR